MKEKEEIELLLKKMMTGFEEISQRDAIYREDIQDLGGIKIQWEFAGVLGYQILELDHYAFKFGERLADPDITFTWSDPEESIKFLSGGFFEGFSSVPRKEYKEMFEYQYITGFEVIIEGGEQKRVRVLKKVMSAEFKKEKPYFPYMTSKLPMFRNVRKMAKLASEAARENYGSMIPINESLGTFESETLPIKVFKHFFEKASNIVMLHSCACRESKDCQDHDQSLGCIFLGDDSLNMLITKEQGRVITSDEGLEILDKAVADNLIPLLGRARGDAVKFGVEDTGHFMTMCFCCSCCCINGKVATHGSVAIANQGISNRMKGVTLKVDENACTACEECFEVCTFRGMEWVDGVAKINQTRCIGCGRCEMVCSSDAISITIDKDSRVNELIAKLETFVDVAPQEA